MHLERRLESGAVEGAWSEKRGKWSDYLSCLHYKPLLVNVMTLDWAEDWSDLCSATLCNAFLLPWWHEHSKITMPRSIGLTLFTESRSNHLWESLRCAGEGFAQCTLSSSQASGGNKSFDFDEAFRATEHDFSFWVRQCIYWSKTNAFFLRLSLFSACILGPDATPVENHF